MGGIEGDFQSNPSHNLPIEAGLDAEEEKQAVVNTAKTRIQLTCDMDDVLTYAAVHNGVHIVRDICVKNISESDLDNLMIQLAAKYLEKWTEDPSLAGYQFEDPNRVKNMAAAVYAAIQ